MTKVFVHGNPETAAIWGPLTSALVERGVDDEMITLSPPGFGAPTAEGWEPTPAAYVEWLAGELADLAGPVDLVGHDWGAGHVFGLLATDTDLVRSWAADCAGLLHPDYVWHDLAQVWQTPGAGEDAVTAVIDIGPEALQETYEGLGLPADIAASMAEAFDAEMGRCILGLYRAAAQPALAELGRRIGGVQVPPGLVVDPADDPYVASELGQQMIGHLDAEHLHLDGRGHWWMVDDPAPAADGLAAFWSRLSAGPGPEDTSG